MFQPVCPKSVGGIGGESRVYRSWACVASALVQCKVEDGRILASFSIVVFGFGDAKIRHSFCALDK